MAIHQPTHRLALMRSFLLRVLPRLRELREGCCSRVLFQGVMLEVPLIGVSRIPSLTVHLGFRFFIFSLSHQSKGIPQGPIRIFREAAGTSGNGTAPSRR